MKILVFDDNKTNREAAKAQLKGHDLTVVGTYDEARKMLGPRIDHSKVDANLKSQFGYSKQRYGDKDEWKYCKARVLAEIAETKDLSNELEYEEYDKRSDTVRAKKWDALLKYLLS